jgi:hypothetical protein
MSVPFLSDTFCQIFNSRHPPLFAAMELFYASFELQCIVLARNLDYLATVVWSCGRGSLYAQGFL